MTQIRERVHGGFYCNSVGLGQLEGKLGWEGCQGVSTAAVLRQTWSPLEVTVVVLVKHQCETSSDYSDLGNAAACCYRPPNHSST